MLFALKTPPFELGKKFFPNGKMLFPCGNFSFPNRKMFFPNGKLSFPNRKKSFPYGNFYFPNGKVSFPKGNFSFPNGKMSFPKGIFLFPKAKTAGRRLVGRFLRGIRICVFIANGLAKHVDCQISPIPLKPLLLLIRKTAGEIYGSSNRSMECLCMGRWQCMGPVAPAST